MTREREQPWLTETRKKGRAAGISYKTFRVTETHGRSHPTAYIRPTVSSIDRPYLSKCVCFFPKRRRRPSVAIGAAVVSRKRLGHPITYARPRAETRASEREAYVSRQLISPDLKQPRPPRLPRHLFALLMPFPSSSAPSSSSMVSTCLLLSWLYIDAASSPTYIYVRSYAHTSVRPLVHLLSISISADSIAGNSHLYSDVPTGLHASRSPQHTNAPSLFARGDVFPS